MSLQNKIEIAVIGTINRDTIISPDGKRTESFGGILYNLKVFSDLLDERAVIYPVVKIGNDCRQEIENYLARLSNISRHAIKFVSNNNNHCILTYLNSSVKKEILEGGVGAVNRSQLLKILDCDLILINFISGYDISYNNLCWLKNNSKASLYIDLHSRTLGKKRDGRRFLRSPARWREYVGMADYLQMNETEFSLLTGGAVSSKNLVRFANRYLIENCKALIVTMGDKGCCLVTRKNNSMEFSECPAVEIKVEDTTGCGDIFSAAFISAIINNSSLRDAAILGNQLAGFRISHSSYDQLDYRHFKEQINPF